jgi:diaminopropionate ammonia-lyase
MRLLGDAGIIAGESGAAGVAGLRELLEGRDAVEARARLGITGQSRILLILTEGATDPANWERVTGRALR